MAKVIFEKSHPQFAHFVGDVVEVSDEQLEKLKGFVSEVEVEGAVKVEKAVKKITAKSADKKI